MKCFYCLLLILCPYFTVAQNSASKSISPGDRAPDIAFSNILNYKSGTANLSDFKGKLVILDFWATWCSGCIKKFPLLDSMQQLHAGNFQPILVNAASTRDTKEKITKLFKRLATTWGRQSILPVAYNDSVTAKLFPHKYLPHYVWISQGSCIAITGADEITAANINAVLQGNPPAFSLKEDLDGFNKKKPLFINGNGGSGSGIINRSTFSAYIYGIPSGSHFNKDKNGRVTRIIFTNTPLFYMLKYACLSGIPLNRTVFPEGAKNTLNPSGFSDSAIIANSYTYELITPPVTVNAALQLMQQDLERLTGFSAAVTPQLTACYILTADTTMVVLHRSRGGASVNKLHTPAEQYMQNRPVTTLAQFLDGRLNKPVVDETGIAYNLDLDFPGISFSNMDEAQKALLAAGFRLTPAQRILPNFIIYQNLKSNE